MDESVMKHLEVVELKPSECMRRGAKLKPQMFHNYYNNDCTASCAMAAMAEGAGFDPNGMMGHLATVAMLSFIAKTWPSFMSSETVCALNNTGSTREEIADYLESKGL